jgi:poly-gamma-glutamate capsule biosynthesis protein CapA/YwtB (metallophosphatase superfamily)
VRRRVIALLAGIALLGGCSAEQRAGAPVAAVGPGSSPAQQPAPQPHPDSFTVVAAGDILIHPALTEQATADGKGKRDYAALFAGVKPVIEGADLAICHLEVPLAKPNGPFKGYPLFSAPPEVATALAGVGYDTCSTASNHTLDQGPDGVANTLDVLDSAGLKHTGSARSAKEAAAPLLMDIKGVKVGHVSFTFDFNSGTSVPAGSPWLGNKLDPAKVIAAAKAARQAGAEVVIASMHWGIEDKHEPTNEQMRLARQLTEDPSIDLIVGHHAHVVQPFELVNGKWVAYGLGNQVARHEQPRGTTEEGAIARFQFVKSQNGWTVGKAEYVPTLVDLGSPIRLRDLTTDAGVDPKRKQQALDRTDQVIRSRGAAEKGLTRQ